MGVTCHKCRKTKPTSFKNSGKQCRSCKKYLRVGINWSPSKQKKYDYICNTCNKNPKKKPNPKKTKSKTINMACPKCGSPLVLRYSPKYSRNFYGCTTYPACRGTRNA